MESFAPMKGTTPELYLMPLAASRHGLPDAYEKARATFEEAKQEYEEGKWGKAAAKFIAVAELVTAPKPETTYSEAFAKMRAIAYKDAALAFEQAGERDAGRKALTAALKADAENVETLKKLLTEFS